MDKIDLKNKSLAKELPLLYFLMKEMKGDPILHKFVKSTKHQTDTYPTGVFYKPLSNALKKDK